jgi:hypothetical protein
MSEERFKEINHKLDQILKIIGYTGSFYKTIHNERYLRSLLDKANEFNTSGGRISELEVEQLIETVNKDGKVSDLETRTLIYILNNYNLTKPAKNLLMKFSVESAPSY